MTKPIYLSRYICFRCDQVVIVCSQDAQLNNGWNPAKSVPRDSRHWIHSWGLLHVGQEMSGMMNHKDFRGLGITITSKSCHALTIVRMRITNLSKPRALVRIAMGIDNPIKADESLWTVHSPRFWSQGEINHKIGVFKGFGIIVTC